MPEPTEVPVAPLTPRPIPGREQVPATVTETQDQSPKIFTEWETASQSPEGALTFARNLRDQDPASVKRIYSKIAVDGRLLSAGPGAVESFYSSIVRLGLLDEAMDGLKQFSRNQKVDIGVRQQILIQFKDRVRDPRVSSEEKNSIRMRLQEYRDGYRSQTGTDLNANDRDLIGRILQNP